MLSPPRAAVQERAKTDELTQQLENSKGEVESLVDQAVCTEEKVKENRSLLETLETEKSDIEERVRAQRAVAEDMRSYLEEANQRMAEITNRAQILHAFMRGEEIKSE